MSLCAKKNIETKGKNDNKKKKMLDYILKVPGVISGGSLAASFIFFTPNKECSFVKTNILFHMKKVPRYIWKLATSLKVSIAFAKKPSTSLGVARDHKCINIT